MADTAKRLAGPSQLTTSAATLYTVPASTTCIVRHIHVANTTANVVTLTLGIGAAGTAANQLFSAYPLNGNAVLDWTGFMVLNAADILSALAGTGSALTITVSGIEVS